MELTLTNILLGGKHYLTIGTIAAQLNTVVFDNMSLTEISLGKTPTSVTAEANGTVIKQKYIAGSNLPTQASSTDYVEIRKKKKDYSGLQTALLLGVTALGVYKGKGAIQKIGKALGKGCGAIGRGFSKLCPNLSNAITSLGKACKTPFKPFIAIGRGIGRIFTKAK